jgi:RNA polymerase sigma-70 factor (ECF subfamily)
LGVTMSAAERDEQDARDMARLVRGHGAALDELMGRHGNKLFHYLVRCLQDEDDAADVAQEAFVRVYQSRERYDARQRFSTWLYTIATNLVRDRFRWRSRHPQMSLDADDEACTALRNALPDSAPSPSDKTETSERVAEVRQAVASLPEELRTAVILSDYEGLPHAQIAAILDCSPKAVESRLYRARNLLRERLKKRLEAWPA